MAVKTSWAAGDVLTAADLTDTFAAKAALASPALTGTPTAPTAAAGTNTTQIATTAFVLANGGLVLLSTQTASAASSVIFNDVFSATYSQYAVYWRLTGSATADLLMRTRVSGSDEAGSNYQRQYINANKTTAGAAQSTAQTSVKVGDIRTNQIGGQFLISSPFLTERTSIASMAQVDYAGGTVTDPSLIIHIGVLNNATSYTGATFFPSTGTFTGKVSIYGVRE